jgi:hypothetical protein
VDFVRDETKKEAAHRRKQESRINTFIFAEKLTGVLLGAFIAIFVFGLGGFLIYKGHDVAGVGICGAGLVSIVTLFVNRQNNASQQVIAKSAPTRKPRPPKTPKQQNRIN